MIHGQLFRLELLNDGLPAMSVYTLNRTPREDALREARKAFYGIPPARQLIFMHSDGFLEVWDTETVACQNP